VAYQANHFRGQFPAEFFGCYNDVVIAEGVVFEEWNRCWHFSISDFRFLISICNDSNSKFVSPFFKGGKGDFFGIRIWLLPFDWAQGGESFDFAQDREPVERLVEPFVIWCLQFSQS
jgi:hypothetical protein